MSAFSNRCLVLASCLAVAATLPAAALAATPEDRSGTIPAGLTQTVDTAHFLVQYNPATPSPIAGTTIAQYAQAVAADFEDAYAHDVYGGGTTPNAGLRPPTADSDAHTDVYLAAPLNNPSFRGGVVYPDVYPQKAAQKSAYVFITPDMPAGSLRFRAGHEFMHLIELAYSWTYQYGPLSEAFANWAAAWALPDVNPLDSNFYGDRYPSSAHPWTSLGCETSQCGSGYWQWMFVQDQVQAYGPGFVTGYYERYAANAAGPHVWDGAYWLDLEIRAASGGAQNLSSRFADYAGDVWDPARWSKSSIRILRDQYQMQPAAFVYDGGSTTDTGTQDVAIDHLAVRYVQVRNDRASQAPPGSQIVLTWQRPSGMTSPVVPLVKYAGNSGWENAAGFAGAQGTFTANFDPAQIQEVVLPLVNDSLTDDGQPFSYRVQVVVPKAPANSAPPVLSGRAAIGRVLSVSPGAWSGEQPISIGYQWQRCGRGRCADVRGAVRRTYKVTSADVGAALRVVVTARSTGGSADAVSNSVGPVRLSASAVKAALSRAIAPRGGDRDARVGALLRRGAYTLRFAAPSAGSLVISWFQVPKGAHVTRARPVLVATARASIAGARMLKVTCRLTPQGKRLLARADRVKLTAKGTFTPRWLSPITVTRTFALSR